jgi:hypothetical protein
MLLTLCLNPVLVSRKIKKIGTMLIVELAQFFSQVFHSRSSSLRLYYRSEDLGEASELSRGDRTGQNQTLRDVQEGV